MGRSGGAQKKIGTKSSTPRASATNLKNKESNDDLFRQFIDENGGEEGRVFKTFNLNGKLIRRNGQVRTRRGNVESMIEEGYRIEGESPKRVLKKEGVEAFFSEEDFTKAEFDYAEFLTNQGLSGPETESATTVLANQEVDQDKLCHRCQEKKYDGPDMFCSTCRTKRARELFRHRDQKPSKPPKAPKEDVLPEPDLTDENSSEEDRILEDFGY